MEEYSEPIYPLTKCEKFNEDFMKHLLTDDMFNKEDRTRLSLYNKHRISGSKVNVSYKLGNGCEQYNLGRLFPEDGIGLQSFRFDIRNPLAEKWYWDIDIENCHYSIALKFCEEFDIKRKYIEDYVNNRERYLKLISNSRKKAKTEFLKILYGGDIKLYDNCYNEVEGNVTDEGIIFLKNLQKEIEMLMIMIWNKYENYHKIKTGKDGKIICKRQNAKASLMSLIFQTEERKILMFLDWLMTKKGRNMGVLIHDGGYVEKIEGETSFPDELLKEFEENINENMGYKIKLVQKKIEYNLEQNKKSLSVYEIMKLEFEKNNFLIGSTLLYIHEDGYMEYMRISDAKTKYRYKNYRVINPETDRNEKKYFIDEWIDDSSRKIYDRVDFIPDLKNCPQNVFNLFKGFNAEKYFLELNNNEIEELIKPIKEHLGYLTSGNEDWILKWMAGIIQCPQCKNEVAILIRDEGGLLVEGGGCGKNLIFEWFGEYILGEKYMYVVGNNKELYGDFNSVFEGKFLVIVEEANGKDNYGNNDYLKSKITSKKINVNKKCVAQYTINDYSNFIFFTNNRNPIPIRQGNRRFSVFDTNPLKRGNENYFKELSHHLSNDETKSAFYQYLKNYPTYNSPIEFQNNIPITSAYIEIRLLNAPMHIKWIISKLRSGELEDDFVSFLYNDYKEWVKESREKSEDIILTLTAFGLILNKSKEANSEYGIEEIGSKHKSTNGNIFYRWNIDGVVSGLKKLGLLEEEFIYKKQDE